MSSSTSTSTLPVEVHELCGNPTEAWAEMKKTRTVMRFKVKTPKEPLPKDKIRVVCLSDTHSLTSHMKRPIPSGDLLLHAGDFTRCGHASEVREFNKWLGTLPHPHKVVIAGNHELSFDPTFHCQVGGLDFLPSPRSSHAGGGDGGGFMAGAGAGAGAGEDLLSGSKVLSIPTLGLERREMQEAVKTEDVKGLLTNCTYLEDSATNVLGLNIYGSPWQPEYCGWAFNLRRGRACLDKWDQIPEGTDLLLTHTPPLGYGDHCCTGVRAGCVELLNTVQRRVKPKYHVYGHIHEGYGVRSDGQTVFVNASACDINYMPNNKPIVFDIPFPEGYSR